MYRLELKQILMAQVRSKRFRFPRFLLLLHCFFSLRHKYGIQYGGGGETNQSGFLIILHNMLTLFKSTAQVLEPHWEVILKNSSEGKSSQQQYIKQCTWSCLGEMVRATSQQWFMDTSQRLDWTARDLEETRLRSGDKICRREIQMNLLKMGTKDKDL